MNPLGAGAVESETSKTVVLSICNVFINAQFGWNAPQAIFRRRANRSARPANIDHDRGDCAPVCQ
jgi:hypothetical protein